MSWLASVARRHQLAAFFLLAYALSWWPWIWFRFDPVTVDAPILPWGPFIAATVMLALIGGWTAIKAWLAKIVHWRVPLVWYVVALLGPPVLTLTAVAINRLLGAAFAAGTASLILGLLHAVWHLPLFGIEYDLQNGIPWRLESACHITAPICQGTNSLSP